MRNLAALAGAAVAFCPVAVAAETPPEPLTPQLQAMLDDALATGSNSEVDAVAKFIKRAVPASAEAVDSATAARTARLAAAAEEARQAKLDSERGLLDGWKGEGQAGAFLSSGNTRSTGVSLGLSLVKEGERWRHNLRAMTDYQRTNGVTSRNQLVAAYEPNFKLNKRLFLFGLAQYERDRFQGYSRRETLSAGLGYRVIDGSGMTLDVKAGPAWRHTDFITGANTNHLSGLAAARYKWVISQSLTLSEAIDALMDSDNTSLGSLTALDAKLVGALSARVSYQIKYESNPPAGIGKTDTLTRLTLVYGF